jgi:hypothetical protein
LAAGDASSAAARLTRLLFGTAYYRERVESRDFTSWCSWTTTGGLWTVETPSVSRYPGGTPALRSFVRADFVLLNFLTQV